MSLAQKAGTAYRLFRDDGAVAVLHRFRQQFQPPKPEQLAPNECQIVFESMDASSFQGFMIDVGAHFGSALNPFANAQWRILAFEPDLKNRERLVNDYGQWSNVKIDSRAVSDEPREFAEFYRSDQSSGISGLSAFHPSHIEAGQVPVTTLRIALEESGEVGRIIDVLKIDTEGFDLYVLKGAPWERLSPRAIICEFEDSKTVPLGYNFHDLANYLVERDYQLLVSEWYPIKEYGTAHAWRRFARYPCELVDSQGWGNIIAVREEVVFEKLLEVCSRYSGNSANIGAPAECSA